MILRDARGAGFIGMPGGTTMVRRAERRQFLGQAIATALAAGSAAPIRGQAFGQGAAAPGDEPSAAQAAREARGMVPIIDTHQHLWDLARFRLPWLKGSAPLARSFLMEDYLEAAEGLGIVKSVYMEVDVEPAQQRAEADYVIDLCRRRVGPLAGAVISGRPASDGFRDEITRYAGEPAIKGLRQVLHGAGTPPGYCLDPK